LSLLSLLSLGSLAAPAFGLEPYLVKDINPVPEPASSLPETFVTLGSVALFVASDEISGEELWRSDGTAAGTWQVADICPQPFCTLNLQALGITSRHYFFNALDENSDWHLWATDGTAAGTFQLTGPGVNAYGSGVAAGDVLYFNVSIDLGEDDYADELWHSDGTPAGTWRVLDRSSYSMVAFKGSFYFTADGELWKTDGTPAGTVIVKELPGSPIALFVIGNRLVFQVYVYTPDPREELWASDGTAEGTRALTDSVLWFPYFSAQGSRLYFVAEDDSNGQELWVTDGTPQNTRALTHLPQWDAFYSTAVGYFLELPQGAAGDRFVFVVNDGSHGIEPWVTDGTVKGTHLLKDFCAGFCDDLPQVWDSTLPGRIFLAVSNRKQGNELWVTDGTAAGTRLVRDICPGSCGGHPYAPFIVKDRLIFEADDGVDGYELWATDGRKANTIRISDFADPEPWGTPGYDDFEGTVAGGQLLLRAPGPEGFELWRADGTGPSGTRLVRDIATADVGGSRPFGLMASGGQAFFFTYPPEGNPEFEIWKSDGTETGTYPLLADNEWIPWKDPKGPEMRAAGNAVFFPVEEMEHGVELWTSDGTVAGTRLVRDVEPGTSGSEPAGLTEFQGKLYFSAFNEALGRELWRTDGTEAGTDLVKAIQPGAGSNPSHLTVHAGRLWFFADDGEHGRELWVSDGTIGGTALAVDVEPGAGSFEPSLLVSLGDRLGDRLLICGQSPSQGSGIWVTDGTAAGTRKISNRNMNEYAVFQGRVWFDSRDAGSQRLWVTDGTEAGTVPVLDRDGQPIPDPERFAALDGHLLFTTRFALWESDGTPAGTVRLLPGVQENELVRAGSRVFFPAFNPETGDELWAVEEAAP
jgi:ELWxxDGT repeat protein